MIYTIRGNYLRTHESGKWTNASENGYILARTNRETPEEI